jgi:hypothetical protein
LTPTPKWLYCYSEPREHKEASLSQRFATRFETALQHLHEGLARPRTLKTIDKLRNRIGRLTDHHGHIPVLADPSINPAW